MIKRKINTEYLNRITATDVRSSRLDALSFTDTLLRFSHEYLAGIMNISVTGYANGCIDLKMPAVSYLVRLLCEDAEDEPVSLSVSLGDKLVIRTTYPSVSDAPKTAHLISVAKLAGFKVERDGSILIFSADIHVTSIMQIYAFSSDDFMDLLITTYKM